jgi:hypothetical protein
LLGFGNATPFLFTVSFSFFGLNSSINPVIYLVRFTDIRNACRQTMRNLVH